MPEPSEASRPGRGQHRSIALNVLTNWIWYALVVVSGFLIPRLIDQRLGPVQLGVWDLCWSLSAYVGLLSLGITSAVARYVAHHRVSDDWSGLNQVINSSLLVLLCGFTVSIVLVLAVDWIALLTPPVDRPKLGGSGRLLAFLLVGSAALQLPAGVYNAVLTGWERFDLLNLIRASRDVAGIILMMAALYAGHGLIALGWINFGLELLATIAKWWTAQRLCGHIRLSTRYCRARTMADLTSFGGKTIVQEFARSGPQQAAALVISRALGPEALALFSRQRNLVMHAYRFTKQYAQVFVPRSAALHAGAEQDRLRDLLINSSRAGFLVALPMLLALAIAGGDLLELWMGPEYRAQHLLAVLALGQILALGQQSALSVLIGMGRHGRAAVADAVVAGAGILILVAWTGMLGGGLMGAAIVIAAAATIAGGLLVPWYACELLNVHFGSYLRKCLTLPLLCVTPYTLVLLAIQFIPNADYKIRLILSACLGSVILIGMYAAFALPRHLRERILRKIGLSRGAPTSSAETSA